MARLKVKCNCGMTVEANVGDKLFDNKLYWFQSYHCCNCGRTIELDGIEKMPLEIEAAIIEQEGKYRLLLNDSKDRKKTEFLLKKNDNLGIFRQFVEKQSDEIAQGTKNEMLLIENFLKSKAGISCTIKHYLN